MNHMNQIRRKTGLTAAVALLALIGSAPVEAGFVAIGYTGTNVFPGASGSSLGSGSFGFVDSPSAVSLAQLTSFNFSQTTTATQVGFPSATGTFTYGLADLLGFSASFGAGGTLTGLSFTTKTVAPSNAQFTPESFVVTSLAINGAGTFNVINQQLQAGTITVTPSAVPEPSSLAMTGVASLAGLGLARYRRKRAAA